MAEENKAQGLVAQLFAASTINDIHPTRNKVITVSTVEKPLDGFQKLIQNKILSAPVWDPKSGKHVGFLDVRDLVHYVVLCYDHQEKEAQKAKEKEKEKEAQQHHARERKDSTDQQGFLTLVLDKKADSDAVQNPEQMLTVKYLAARNKYTPVADTADVGKIAEAVCQPEIHRVPIEDKDGKLVDIISQSAIVSFINRNSEKLKSVLNQTLGDLGLAKKTVISVRDTDSAINCFKLITTKNLSGLAVVDKDGRVVGNTSASDMKLFIQMPSFRILKMPLVEYLNVIRRQNLKDVVPVVGVKAGDTLGKVVAKLAATNMHRIFVIDDDRRPIGVVSCRDIIEKCLKV
jgi:CBS-domain-containing membrane protein